ncbi:hypothetical protein ACGFIG_21850 [Micromonospora sp. NPDC049048]|uniref:hypothetical protein n=1 Tax=Micromonospora sp. NPDC049048 TaxID=3364263 RepID=UPI00371C96F2
MPQDEQFDLDEILARVASDTLETLRATTDIERRLQQVTTAPPRQRRRTRILRRCKWPAS